MKLRARGGATCTTGAPDYIFLVRGDDIVHHPSLLLYALDWLLLYYRNVTLSAQIDPAESAS